MATYVYIVTVSDEGTWKYHIRVWKIKVACNGLCSNWFKHPI